MTRVEEGDQAAAEGRGPVPRPAREAMEVSWGGRGHFLQADDVGREWSGVVEGGVETTAPPCRHRWRELDLGWLCSDFTASVAVGHIFRPERMRSKWGPIHLTLVDFPR